MTQASRAGRRTGIAAAVVLAIIVGIALIGPTSFGRSASDSGDLRTDRLSPPSAAHPFGTDASSRDVMARVVQGTRVSLGIAVLSVGILFVIGVAWGGLSGLAPAAADRWMMRLVDALLATPRLLIVLAVVAFTGRLAAPALALLLGLTGWAQMSRVVRARVREVRASDHVVAARALGTPALSLFLRHILPEVAPTAFVMAILAAAAVVPLEASLSFIGAGVAPPTASWGVLLRDATDHPTDAWWLLLFPSVVIATTVMCVNMLGERLQPRDRNFLAR